MRAHGDVHIQDRCVCRRQRTLGRTGHRNWGCFLGLCTRSPQPLGLAWAGRREASWGRPAEAEHTGQQELQAREYVRMCCCWKRGLACCVSCSRPALPSNGNTCRPTGAGGCPMQDCRVGTMQAAHVDEFPSDIYMCRAARQWESPCVPALRRIRGKVTMCRDKRRH